MPEPDISQFDNGEFMDLMHNEQSKLDLLRRSLDYIESNLYDALVMSGGIPDFHEKFDEKIGAIVREAITSSKKDDSDNINLVNASRMAVIAAFRLIRGAITVVSRLDYRSDQSPMDKLDV